MESRKRLEGISLMKSNMWKQRREKDGRLVTVCKEIKRKMTEEEGIKEDQPQGRQETSQEEDQETSLQINEDMEDNWLAELLLTEDDRRKLKEMEDWWEKAKMKEENHELQKEPPEGSAPKTKLNRTTTTQAATSAVPGRWMPEIGSMEGQSGPTTNSPNPVVPSGWMPGQTVQLGGGSAPGIEIPGRCRPELNRTGAKQDQAGWCQARRVMPSRWKPGKAQLGGGSTPVTEVPSRSKPELNITNAKQDQAGWCQAGWVMPSRWKPGQTQLGGGSTPVIEVPSISKPELNRTNTKEDQSGWCQAGRVMPSRSKPVQTQLGGGSIPESAKIRLNKQEVTTVAEKRKLFEERKDEESKQFAWTKSDQSKGWKKTCPNEVKTEVRRRKQANTLSSPKVHKIKRLNSSSSNQTPAKPTRLPAKPANSLSKFKKLLQDWEIPKKHF